VAYGGFQGFLLSLEPPFIRLREVEVVMPGFSEVFVDGQLVRVVPSFSEGGWLPTASEGGEQVPATEFTETWMMIDGVSTRIAVNGEMVIENIVDTNPMTSEPQVDNGIVVIAETAQEEFNADVQRRSVLSERAAQREAMNNEIVECVSCCDEMRRGSAFYAEWDGEYYCEDCYYRMEEQIEQEQEEERREDMGEHIRYYSYRPNSIFRDVDWDELNAVPTASRRGQEGRLYMGFELEVECEHSRGRIADRLYEKANDWGSPVTSYGELVYLKEDGSLSNGFEIVTHPCSLDFYQEFFPWGAIEALREQDVTAWNSRSCGLHVHMSRNSFVDERHLWKFIVFVYKNPQEMIKFAGRNSSYARFERGNLLNFYDYDQNRFSSATYMSHAKGKTRNDDRYTAVNLQPVHTIELRFFRPSLRTKTVRAALEFCAAVHEYTNSVSTKEVLGGALKWPRFRAWVAGQAKYKVLDERIAERFDESDDH